MQQDPDEQSACERDIAYHDPLEDPSLRAEVLLYPADKTKDIQLIAILYTILLCVTQYRKNKFNGN